MYYGVDQQDRAGRYVRLDRKGAIEVVASVIAVLLELLRFVVQDLAYGGHKGQPEARGQAPRERRHQLGMMLRRDAGDPRRCWLGAPPFPDHLGDRLDQLIPEIAGALVLGNPPPPSGVAPAGQDATGFGTQFCRQAASKAELGERPGSHLLVALERQVRMPEKPGRLVRQERGEPLRDDRVPEAPRTAATTPGVGIVQGLGQELHQASRSVDVTLQLPPFQLPLEGQALDAILIHLVSNGGPPPEGAVSDHWCRALRRQVFQGLLDLSFAQIDHFLELPYRQIVAIGQGIQDCLYVLRAGKGGGAEIFVDVAILAAGEQHADGGVDGAAGAADLLIVTDDGTWRLVMNDEAQIGLVISHPKGGGGDESLELVAQQHVFEMLAVGV